MTQIDPSAVALEHLALEALGSGSIRFVAPSRDKSRHEKLFSNKFDLFCPDMCNHVRNWSNPISRNLVKVRTNFMKTPTHKPIKPDIIILWGLHPQTPNPADVI